MWSLTIGLAVQFGGLAVWAGDKQPTTDESAELALVSEKGSPGSKQGRVAPVTPNEIHFEFVRDNLTATLYHELAHAMIDMMSLPVLGQEEDAADVLSTVMVNIRHSEQDARRIARNSSQAYAFEADKSEARGEIPSLWDEHGPARQRYYNAICLFVGANPETRMDLAQELGLPDSRADYCDAEYDLAARSWQPILDQMSKGSGRKISFRDKSRDPLGHAAAQALSGLVAGLNEEYSLPDKLEILLKRCGSQDRGYEAFYSEFFEGEGSITVCTEYVRDLYRISSGEP